MLNYSSFTINILHTLNIVHNELQLDEEWNDGTIHGLCMLTIVPLKSLLFSESPHWYIRELYLKKKIWAWILVAKHFLSMQKDIGLIPRAE